MAGIRGRRHRRRGKSHVLGKPRGSIHPRVQKVAPQHFGIVSEDCAKARSKWMLADFWGNVIVAPTLVQHSRGGGPGRGPSAPPHDRGDP